MCHHDISLHPFAIVTGTDCHILKARTLVDDGRTKVRRGVVPTSTRGGGPVVLRSMGDGDRPSSPGPGAALECRCCRLSLRSLTTSHGPASAATTLGPARRASWPELLLAARAAAACETPAAAAAAAGGSDDNPHHTHSLILLKL